MAEEPKRVASGFPYAYSNCECEPIYSGFKRVLINVNPYTHSFDHYHSRLSAHKVHYHHLYMAVSGEYSVHCMFKMHLVPLV